MVKYGKGVIMTRKMTITLEDEILTNLDEFALKKWKKENSNYKRSFDKLLKYLFKR